MLLGVMLLLRNSTFHSAIRTGQIQNYLQEGYKILKRLVPVHCILCLYTFPYIYLQNISKKYDGKECGNIKKKN